MPAQLGSATLARLVPSGSPTPVSSAAAWLAQVPPIYWIAPAVLTGDGLGNFHVYVPLWAAVAAALAGAALFVAVRPGLGTLVCLIGIAAAATVAVHDLLEPPNDPLSIRRFPDNDPITIEGRLVREAETYHGRIHLLVGVERAGESPRVLRPARGTVRVTVLERSGFEPYAFKIGQYLRLTSRIRFPRNFGNPGEFDYELYQAREGIGATMVVGAGRRIGGDSIEIVGYRPRLWASSIEATRRRIGAFIDANLGHPAREEMRALVIGDQGEIGEDLRDSFALTGMAHLLVISGLHLSLVAASAFAAARLAMGFFPLLMIKGYANKLSAVAAALAVMAYASIAGHHVSTARALVMVLAYLFAVVVDRSREVLASLALAALIICLGSPGSTADIGFQLSFASVTAIVLGMRRFRFWWEGWRKARAVPGDSPGLGYRAGEIVASYFAVSFWAMLGTAPLTAYHFNQFAIVGIVSNAIVVPIMGAAGTVLGLAAVAMSFVFPPVARPMLWGAGQLLALGTALARWFVALPMAWTRTFTPTLAELAIIYALVALWLCRPMPDARGKPVVPDDASRRESPPPKRRRMSRALAGALVVALSIDALWWIHDRYFNSELRVTFLSVGQGDCAVVRFPGARVMVIDAGGQFGEFDPGERILAPFLWSQKIMRVDYIVLSHPELDHFGGFAFIARNFSPTQFWAISVPSPDIKYVQLLGKLAEAGVKLSIVDSSFPPMRIGGVGIRCLNPRPGDVASRNNSSMVLRFDFGPTSVLFTGDLEAAGERALMERGPDLRATILKAPHHGSATSSSDPFVESVHPSAVVIPVGYRNRFDFPAIEVVDRYRRVGARVLRTDQDGAVEIDATLAGMALRTGRRRP